MLLLALAGFAGNICTAKAPPGYLTDRSPRQSAESTSGIEFASHREGPYADSTSALNDPITTGTAYSDRSLQTWLARELSGPATADESGQCIAECGCAKCQKDPSGGCKAGAQKAAATAYKGLFYNNDFSYLEKPGASSDYLTDDLKRIGVGCLFTFDVGGEYRLRNHNESNMGGSRFNGLNNDFLLQRTRLYANAQIGRRFRVYTEMIDATSAYEDLAPRTIEENRADYINLFGDVILWDEGDGSLSARGGRNELLYGNQRLVSPLDWSNTRRTFDGAKLFWSGKIWDIDGFWTRPVPFGQHVNNDHNFDSPDLSQDFLGVYATNKRIKDHTFDFYYLRLAEWDGPVNDFDANTFGGRWLGKCDCWLWEVEGAYQFGQVGALNQSAGFYTIGFGRELSALPAAPTLWIYFDWASGDANPSDGDVGTFNQLFPLGHKYLGFMDMVGRRNIQSWNFLATAKPHDRLRVLLWWYVFHLEEARDALYNAAGAPIRVDPNATAGTDVGQEIDLVLDVTINGRTSVLFGYSHFFTGDFIANTAPFVADDADFYYTQFSRRF